MNLTKAESSGEGRVEVACRATVNTGSEVDTVNRAEAPPLPPTTLTIGVAKHSQLPQRLRRITMPPRVTMHARFAQPTRQPAAACRNAGYILIRVCGWLAEGLSCLSDNSSRSITYNGSRGSELESLRERLPERSTGICYGSGVRFGQTPRVPCTISPRPSRPCETDSPRRQSHQIRSSLYRGAPS